MHGVRLLDLVRHTDSRGSLVAFASDLQMPFEVRNVYFLLDCPSGVERAGHAVSSDMALIVLNSAVTVDIDNGTELQTLRLDDPEKALVVCSGVWLCLRDFTPDTVVAVLASHVYTETKYFAEPEPALLHPISP